MASASYDFHHLPHVKTQSESKKALWVTLALTILFTAVEIAGGFFQTRSPYCPIPPIWLPTYWRSG